MLDTIQTSSNHFIYDQLNIPTVTHTIGYFNNEWLPVQRFHHTFKHTGDEIKFNVDIDHASIIMIHIYGTFTKDITKEISYYNFNTNISNVKPVNPASFNIEADPHSNIDYFDNIFVIPSVNQNGTTSFFWKVLTQYDKLLTSSQSTLDIYMDVYNL